MAPENNAAGSRGAKRRRHGYRGYGSPLRPEQTGAVHWGRGFGGVGFPDDGGILAPRRGHISEEQRKNQTPEE